MSPFLLIDKRVHYIIVGKKSLCNSRLSIHYYHNRRYKSYITSLKAVIASNCLISVGLDIDGILHFILL